LRPPLHAALGLLILLGPLAATLTGARNLASIRLDLGPGDGPYTSGFLRPNPESFDPYELKEGVATHWTSHDARIHLPLEVLAPALGLEMRFARHFADRGRLEVRLAGTEAARFEVLKGYQEYTTTVALSGATPLLLDLHTEATNDRGLGVSLDWVRFDLPPQARVRLRGPTRLRPLATLTLVVLVLLGAGFAFRTAILLALPVATLACAFLLTDPWLLVRLLRGVPEALLLLVVPTAVLFRWLAGRGSAPVPGLRLATGLLLLVFLLRALALNHPAFFNPDLRIHASLVRVVREARLDLLRAPAAWLYTPREANRQEGPSVRATSGLWLRSLRGVSFGLPYSLAPHALLAPLPLDYDGLLTALKLLGAFAAALTAALVVFLAPRVGAPGWAGALVGLAPTAGVELALGAVPAVVGHAADVALLLFLATVWARMAAPRVALGAALAVAAGELVYVSSVLLEPLLVASLVGLTLVGKGAAENRARVRGLLVAFVSGSLLAFLLYYRDFVPGTWTALRLVAGGDQASLADPGEHRVASALLAWGLPILPLLALAGLVSLLRNQDPGPRAPVVAAWALTAVLLGALQWREPGLFGFLHLPLFVTPLLALGAARSLQTIAGPGGGRLVLAFLLAVGLGLHGLWLQARALSAELVLRP
jgi:hypothetical protein